MTATAGIGKIIVSWKADNKPNLAGYIVERASLHAGPYEVLDAQALPPGTAQYEDTEVRGGTTYYYRVRAVNSRGDLGNPSSAAFAQAKNPDAPPKVAGLAADAGQTRVRLTWKPVAFPIAGYFVERRTTTGLPQPENWVRLNPRVSPEPQYDDYLGLTSNAKMEYRIVAVAFDNLEGAPSDSVAVAVADRSLPSEPFITSANGAEGKANINFEPADPAEKTAQFLVLRSGRVDDIGLVIGDPLPGSARTFTDLYVSPGASYWYRLVAVDKNGNRSDPTRAVVVRVGPPPIPKPPSPTVQLVSAPFPHVLFQFSQVPAGSEDYRRTAGYSEWVVAADRRTVAGSNGCRQQRPAVQVSRISHLVRIGGRHRWTAQRRDRDSERQVNSEGSYGPDVVIYSPPVDVVSSRHSQSSPELVSRMKIPPTVSAPALARGRVSCGWSRSIVIQ